MKPLPSEDHQLTKQLVIIHLSDLHFGRTHRFNPPKAPSGDIPARKGSPTLLEKLSEDLNLPSPNCPLIICATGDFAETGALNEFQHALEFLKGLGTTAIYGQPRGLSSIFAVAGNHDVSYESSTPDLRLANFGWFMNALYGAGTADSDPSKWKIVRDAYDSFGVIVASLNSSAYVEKGKPDQDRGNLDPDQLTQLERSLKMIDAAKMQRAIKVALIHHHPVLIPALAEPGRGYDAVLNSGRLLTILRKHGFHMILHGHKHDPYVFTEDSRSAFRTSSQNPILIAAGGSVGSTELPMNRWNCYNRITIKWHPAAAQARILIETRGLSVFDEDENEALPADWHWKTLRSDDLHFLKGQCVPSPRSVTPSIATAEADKRSAEYSRLRGNMLAVEVRPSLTPGQGYQAIVWIVSHNRKANDEPREVEWSAGPKFKAACVVRQEHDGRFCGSFDYWGPMLIQARITFGDGTDVYGFIYARLPEDCSDSA
jgi:3',5'-cyclic AMP phosphodiesterase CpdA